MTTITENIADRLTGGKLTEQAAHIASLSEQAAQDSLQLAMVQESLQRLEQAINSSEWRLMSMQAEHEFTRQGLNDIIGLARIMRIKNPIIKRGVEVQRLYVFAQGMQITAVDKRVNEVIQAFLDDERNRAELTSHQPRSQKETELQTDGNLFFRFFVNPQTGRVRVRTIDPLEIDDIICNPEDAKEPWFYRRTWAERALDGSTTQRTAYYPDWRYTPRAKTAVFPGIEWDTPVCHVAVNRLGRWGVPEFYAALDWALAYKSFLEQLASVWQALARWAAKLTVKGGSRGVSAAKTKLATTLGSGGETNPPPLTASTFIGSEGVDLQPFRTAGATMSADDGRRLFLMAAAVFGLPETFFGDVSVGTLATARSLDRPTELKIVDRQRLWADIFENIINFVLLSAAKAPQGMLRGLAAVERQPDGGQVDERLMWAKDVDGTVKVSFPPIVEDDVAGLVGAIVDAATLKGSSPAGSVPLETAVRELLRVLGIADVDDVMKLWQEEQEERQARADEMAARMGSGGGQQPPNSDQQQEAWERQVTAVTDLLAEVRGAMNGQ